MNYRNVLVIVIVLSVAAWWFFHEDAEAEVHNAHQELARLLSKKEGEAGSSMIINARVLQGMFAETCEISGDAEMLAGSYSAEELVSTIVRIQGMFLSAELSFHDLLTEFPAEDDAITKFRAVLVGRSQIEGEEKAAETRDVVSQMRKIDGEWAFAGFDLAKVIED